MADAFVGGNFAGVAADFTIRCWSSTFRFLIWTMVGTAYLTRSKRTRPSSKERAGAVAAVNALARSNLFQGQSQAFFDFITQLAQAADAATP
jgi:hypothetical protein